MRHVCFVTLSALALLASGAAMAQDAPTAAAPAPKATVAKERKICHWETPTGSNMGESVCHTSSEWAAIAAQHDAENRTLRNPRGWDNNGH